MQDVEARFKCDRCGTVAVQRAEADAGIIPRYITDQTISIYPDGWLMILDTLLCHDCRNAYDVWLKGNAK